METPLIDHLTKKDYENVYEPAEDTFLLIDAIESDLKCIEQLEPSVCLEIGTGSGVILTAVSKKLKCCVCLGTDINYFACSITKRTGIHNQVKCLEAINMNLGNCFRDCIFDIVIFNPPYVVTSNEECLNLDKDLLAYTWAGGINGRLIIDKFLKQLNSILSLQGVCYLLLLKENQPKNIINDLNEGIYQASILIERRIIGEHLYVIKIIRK